MNNLFNNRTLCALICFVLGLFIATSVSIAQEKHDEDLKKKYAPILGEYEFDWRPAIFILYVYIEDGSLWADFNNGSPATMESQGDEPFEFKAEDPVSGIFEIKFLEDDQGEYTICHLVITSLGLDVKGNKIK
ncbi:MAG: hypothetical protein PVI66_12015 [Candidatus Aminicenantes bacterium]|jgi:hypothetical protein